MTRSRRESERARDTVDADAGLLDDAAPTLLGEHVATQPVGRTVAEPITGSQADFVATSLKAYLPDVGAGTL